MAERRRELRLSIVAAAAKAGIDRMTWSSAEKGTRQLAEQNWAGVETALDWTSGSVEKVLAGEGKPGRIHHATASAVIGSVAGSEAQVAGDLAPPLAEKELEREIDRISRLHRLPVQERMRMVRVLVEMNAEAARRYAELAE